MSAQVAAPGEAVAAPAADHVPFSADQVAREEVHHVGPGLDNPADKLMPNGHGHWDGGLRPLVPLVDVHVGAADTRAQHLDQHVVDADLGNVHFAEPEARLAPALHQRLHTFTITASAFTASAKAGTGRLPFLHWFTVTDGGGVPEPFSIGLFGLHISVY